MFALTPAHSSRRVREGAPGRSQRKERTQVPRKRRAVSGRRYYSPSQGRFVNRDPIDENGGIALYAFVHNDPVNHWDVLGMMDDNMCYDPELMIPVRCGSTRSTGDAIKLGPVTVTADRVPKASGSQSDRLNVPGIPVFSGFNIPSVNYPLDLWSAVRQIGPSALSIECAGIQARLESATAIQEKYARQFGPGGALQGFQGVTSAQDVLSLLSSVSDSGLQITSLGVDKISENLPVGQGLHSIDLSKVPAVAFAGAALTGVDIGLDALNFIGAASDQDVGQALSSGSGLVLTIGAGALTLASVNPVIGVSVGFAKFSLSGAVFVYAQTKNQGLRQGFAEAVSESAAAYTLASQTTRSLEAEKTSKNCP